MSLPQTGRSVVNYAQPTRRACWFSVAPIVGLHLLGLRAGRPQMSWPDRLVFAGLPLFTGAFSFALSPRLEGLSTLLAACSLLVGAMLTLFVFPTDLRLKLSETSALSYRRRLQRLVGSGVVSTMYLAVLALASALALASSADVPALKGLGLRRPGSALVIALLTHLAVNLLTVICRVLAVYLDVFGADFGADLAPWQVLPT